METIPYREVSHTSAVAARTTQYSTFSEYSIGLNMCPCTLSELFDWRKIRLQRVLKPQAKTLCTYCAFDYRNDDALIIETTTLFTSSSVSLTSFILFMLISYILSLIYFANWLMLALIHSLIRLDMIYLEKVPFLFINNYNISVVLREDYVVIHCFYLHY